jgi:hypothetical protein
MLSYPDSFAPLANLLGESETGKSGIREQAGQWFRAIKSLLPATQAKGATAPLVVNNLWLCSQQASLSADRSTIPHACHGQCRIGHFITIGPIRFRLMRERGSPVDWSPGKRVSRLRANIPSISILYAVTGEEIQAHCEGKEVHVYHIFRALRN